MRRFYYCLCLLLPYCLLHAGSGGPDGFGYTWLDSDDPNGPVFSWVDITTLPGAVQVTGLGDENSVLSIPMQFDFRYYWIDYDEITIGSNGWLSFEEPLNIPHCFPPLPSSSGPNSLLAPYMSDLSFSSSYMTLPNLGECWYWSNQQDSFIVSYLNVPWWETDNGGIDPPDWVGSNTFQIIFDGNDSSITYQYASLTQEDIPFYTGCNRNFVIGIEDPIGLNGLQVVNDTLPPDSFAIKFIFPAQDTFEVADASPVSQLNPDSRGQFFFTDSLLPLSVRVAHLGNTDFNTDIEVEHKVQTRTFLTKWTETDTIAPLAAGRDTLLQFNLPITLGVMDTGQYYFETRIVNAEDLNINNDIRETELNLINSATNSHNLRYCTGFTPNLVLSWPVSFTGDFGGGVFMDPPFDVYKIRSVDAWIVGNDGLPQTPLPTGFKIEILAPDSMGNPGAVLDSRLILPQNAIEDGWNHIEFDPPVNILEGGFYIAWIQGGNGIGLGTESIGPKSRQSFEILSGTWAPYRFAEGEDLLLRAEVDRSIDSREASLPSTWTAQIGPNPGQERLHLRLDLSEITPLRLEVLDLKGQVLVRKTLGDLPAGQLDFDFHWGLPSGTYLIRIEDGHQALSFKWSVIR